ncbi:MAG: hypothetical protein M3P38_01040 [Chloroflexota bacterium]|nr:hypothetical protein [Chloroflexota bacterium]
MPRPISHDDAEREFEPLVAAVSVRDLNDDEVEQFALLLGKFMLLSTSHPGAVEFLEREEVKRAIYELGIQLNNS